MYAGYEEESGRLSEGGLSYEDREFLKEYKMTIPADGSGEPGAAYLADALEAALSFAGEGLPLAELVAEANAGIAEALSEGVEDPDGVGEYIMTSIRRYTRTSGEAAENDGLLIREVSDLSEAIDRFTEEYGEKPTIDELANLLGVNQDRILDILKLTGDEPKETGE